MCEDCKVLHFLVRQNRAPFKDWWRGKGFHPVVTGDAGLSKRGSLQTQCFIIILPSALPCKKTGEKSSISASSNNQKNWRIHENPMYRICPTISNGPFDVPLGCSYPQWLPHLRCSTMVRRASSDGEYWSWALRMDSPGIRGWFGAVEICWNDRNHPVSTSEF